MYWGVTYLEWVLTSHHLKVLGQIWTPHCLQGWVVGTLSTNINTGTSLITQTHVLSCIHDKIFAQALNYA